MDIKGFSPRYTAPEVFGRVTSNTTEVSIEYEMKGDVYSFALVLWSMETRKIPWANCFFSFFFSDFLFSKKTYESIQIFSEGIIRYRI
mgnify:CR=1 FL=1